MDPSALHAFFHPRTVAVVGASAKPGKIGHTVVANMLAAGFKGRLFPVNPRGGDIEGLPVVTSISGLPRGIDLAVIAVPRDSVLPAMEELAALGLKSAIVITAGFKEAGQEGYRLERQLVELCERHGIAMLGPNCLGMLDTGHGVNASFAATGAKPGDLAFFSQSGALCVSILDWAADENIGFSKFISLGNKALLDEIHMLEALGADPASKVIIGYIESVQNGEAFLRTAREVCRVKPVIMLKAGSTAAGAKAASSHTGAIAGSDSAYGAAFKQCGIIRAPDVESLFDLAGAFSSLPLPRGPNVAIVTNSGGPGILAADACEKRRLHMARLSPETIQKLQGFLPSYASLYNPVDMVGDADAERCRKTLETVLDDPLVHSVLFLVTPTSSVEMAAAATAVAHLARRSDKPVYACLMGREHVQEGKRVLQEAGLPCFSFPETAMQCIEAMYSYALWRQMPVPLYESPERDLDAARRIVRQAIDAGQTEIVEFQARELLGAYRLPTPRTVLARKGEDAVAAAEELGFPVALKIASPQISHKTDVGGVVLNLKSAAQVRQAFWDMTTRVQRLRPDAYVAGCLVQEMSPPGARELIVGFKRDEQFGPLVMFGLGGIHVEILKDVAFRLAPLSRDDAFGMVREIRSYMLLKGVHGGPAIEFRALEDILLVLSALAMDFPQIYEAEFNPVLVNHERALVADVRVTLRV